MLVIKKCVENRFCMFFCVKGWIWFGFKFELKMVFKFVMERWKNS